MTEATFGMRHYQVALRCAMQETKYVYVVIECRQDEDLIRHVSELDNQAFAVTRNSRREATGRSVSRNGRKAFTLGGGTIIADVAWDGEKIGVDMDEPSLP